MEYIVWKDSFNIGVKEMDEQHKLLVSNINELYNAINTGNSESVVKPTLIKLTDYIKVHFAAEENLLKMHNYPMIESQIAQHAHYISEIAFMESSLMNKKQTAQNMLLFLKDWFIHHITTEDLKYIECVC